MLWYQLERRDSRNSAGAARPTRPEEALAILRGQMEGPSEAIDGVGIRGPPHAAFEIGDRARAQAGPFASSSWVRRAASRCRRSSPAKLWCSSMAVRRWHGRHFHPGRLPLAN